MVAAMNSEKLVLDSWAELKTIENYDSIAGRKLFQYLFQDIVWLPD